MRKFARTPAFFILLAAAALAAYAARSPLSATSQRDGKSLEDVERLIAAGNVDSTTWLSYALKLNSAGRFAHAADAYRRALTAQPPLADSRSARFELGLTLAQTPNADAFFDYIHQVTLTDARLAVDILDRRECQSKSADPRFTPAVKEAQAQAVD